MIYKNNNNQEDGQGLVEYALILVLVAVVVIVLLSLLGDGVGGTFAQVSATLSGQTIRDSGTSYVLMDFDADVVVSGGGATCDLTINDITVMKFEDGVAQDSGSGSFSYAINGTSRTANFTVGDTTTDLGSQAAFSGSCPLTVTTPEGFSQQFGG